MTDRVSNTGRLAMGTARAQAVGAAPGESS